jgi:hypothetical protein
MGLPPRHAHLFAIKFLHRDRFLAPRQIIPPLSLRFCGARRDTALRLSYYFGNTPKFWLGLQNDFDLEEEKKSKLTELRKIKKINEHAA